MPHEDIDRLAEETGFSGVVRIDRAGEIEFANAYGFANRAYRVPNTPDTRFGIASGSKGFTALAVLSLVREGLLDLGTTARSLLGADLPWSRTTSPSSTCSPTPRASATTWTKKSTPTSPTTRSARCTS